MSPENAPGDGRPLSGRELGEAESAEESGDARRGGKDFGAVHRRVFLQAMKATKPKSASMPQPAAFAAFSGSVEPRGGCV